MLAHAQRSGLAVMLDRLPYLLHRLFPRGYRDLISRAQGVGETSRGELNQVGRRALPGRYQAAVVRQLGPAAIALLNYQSLLKAALRVPLVPEASSERLLLDHGLSPTEEDSWDHHGRGPRGREHHGWVPTVAAARAFR